MFYLKLKTMGLERRLSALSLEDLGLILSTYLVTHNFLYLQSQRIQHPLLAPAHTL